MPTEPPNASVRFPLGPMATAPATEGGESALSDAISLTFPREKPYHAVARLVVGGLAARLDFSYEHLEDLQLALESLLDEAYRAGDEVTVEVKVEPGLVEMLVGPLAGDRVRPALEREGDEREGIGLRRLLATVAEGVRVEEVGGGAWLHLEKRVPGGGVPSP